MCGDAMVVIEEVDDDEEETTTDTRALPKETGEETTSKPAKKVGFYVFLIVLLKNSVRASERIFHVLVP